MNLQEHWDKAYQARNLQDLGWYEAESTPSLQLIKECNLDKKARIINVGAGTSTLTDSLLDLGFANVIVTDLSQTALDQLKVRLLRNDVKVTFIQDDLARPAKLHTIESVDLWHDRAVLHFLTKAEDQDAYFKLLKKLVKKDAFVILAEFELETGAKKCCNLDVQRYNVHMLSEKLGPEFELIKSFSYDYKNPREESRPYIYTLFKRTS